MKFVITIQDDPDFPDVIDVKVEGADNPGGPRNRAATQAELACYRAMRAVNHGGARQPSEDDVDDGLLGIAIDDLFDHGGES